MMVVPPHPFIFSRKIKYYYIFLFTSPEYLSLIVGNIRWADELY